MPRDPGSPEALVRGCKCSPSANHNGTGAGENRKGETLFVIHPKCPLHGDEKYRKADDR